MERRPSVDARKSCWDNQGPVNCCWEGRPIPGVDVGVGDGCEPPGEDIAHEKVRGVRSMVVECRKLLSDDPTYGETRVAVWWAEVELDSHGHVASERRESKARLEA